MASQLFRITTGRIRKIGPPILGHFVPGALPPRMLPPPIQVVQRTGWPRQYRPFTQAELFRLRNAPVVIPNFPPPPLVVRQIARRRRIARARIFVIESGFRAATVNPPVRPLHVLLVRIKRARGQVVLHGPVGKRSTANSPIRALEVVHVVGLRARPQPRKRAFLGRPFGYKTRKPPVRPPLVVHLRIRRRPPTRAQFVKPVGRRATVTPPIRPLLVAGVRIRRRPSVHAQFIRPVAVTAVPPIVVRVKGIRVIAVRLRRRPVVHVQFIRPASKRTTFPRRLLVELARIRRVPRTLVGLFRPVVHPIIVARHVQGIRVVLARVRRRPQFVAKFSRRYGHVTRRPPIYPVHTVLFASRERMGRRRVRGFAKWSRVVRGGAVPPPVGAPMTQRLSLGVSVDLRGGRV